MVEWAKVAPEIRLFTRITYGSVLFNGVGDAVVISVFVARLWPDK